MQQALEGLDIHPMRESLYAELHSRPFHVIASPARVAYFALLADEEVRNAQFEHLLELFEHSDQDAPECDGLFYEVELNGLRIRRERHLEFTTYTFIDEQPPKTDNPFDATALQRLPEGWMARLPGQVVSAFHVAIQDARETPEDELPVVKNHFEGQRLIGSSPQNGDARIWTSFLLHSDGLGRFLIFNKAMSDSQLGRLTQRVIEIETYRLMTLLSLPLARKYSPGLSAMDKRLAVLTERLTAEKGVDEAKILSELTEMAAWVEACRAQTTFRFGASRAYQEIVSKRLAELREDEVSGHLTITEFMTRRLTPAVRTCESVSERLENMSLRIDRVSDMMRTRVELSIQEQNQDLLSSMDRRSHIQLMMQHTVEGLSVAAISYYTIGLLKFLIDAVYEETGGAFDKSLVLGVTVPCVVGCVWFATRRIHRRFLKLATERADAERH